MKIQATSWRLLGLDIDVKTKSRNLDGRDRLFEAVEIYFLPRVSIETNQDRQAHYQFNNAIAQDGRKTCFKSASISF